MDEPLHVLRLPATTTADGAQTRHVLVVDDEPAILEIFREVLSDEGCRVTGLGGPPSPEEIGRLAPDAIVLDLVFGGHMSGLGLLYALRGDPATAGVPIVVCTALTEAGIAAVLADFPVPILLLTKPFDLDDAVVAIRTALDPCVAGYSA